MLGDFEYRYCRNDQCGVADDVQTAPGKSGRPISTSLVPQDLQDSVSAWSWFQPQTPAALTGLPVTQRADRVLGRGGVPAFARSELAGLDAAGHPGC